MNIGMSKVERKKMNIQLCFLVSSFFWNGWLMIRWPATNPGNKTIPNFFAFGIILTVWIIFSR